MPKTAMTRRDGWHQRVAVAALAVIMALGRSSARGGLPPHPVQAGNSRRVREAPAEAQRLTNAARRILRLRGQLQNFSVLAREPVNEGLLLWGQRNLYGMSAFAHTSSDGVLGLSWTELLLQIRNSSRVQKLS